MTDLPNWKHLTLDQKKASVAPLLADGMTAKQISERFTDSTRNSIIGFCNRHELPLLGKPGGWSPSGVREVKPKRAKRDKHATKTNFIADRARKARAALPKIDAEAFEIDGVTPEDEPGHDCTGMIGIMELTSVTCRWFHGDPKKVEKGYCGKPTENGGSYCPEHAARVYLRAKP